MRILSLNTWQQRGPWKERWEVIFRGMAVWRPDVAAFQEVFDPEWAALIRKRTSLTHLVYDEQSSGLILLSRFPLAPHFLLTYQTKSPLENYSRYCLFAEVRTETGLVAFLNTHLSYRPGESAVREGQILEMLNFMEKKAEGKDVILTGDFNATPSAPEMALIGRKGGLRDAYAELYPGKDGWTWNYGNPYTKFEENKVEGSFLPERRIDYLFYRSGVVLGKLKAIEIVFDIPDDKGVWASDHFGLLADFEILF